MDISLDQAQKMLGAAINKADNIKVPLCIAIVDRGGHLIAFNRLDDAVIGTIDFAIRKAKTAAFFGVNTEIMGQVVESAGASGYGLQSSNGGVLTIGGGVVVKNKDGKIVGAIGVSGGMVEQDMSVAQAGAQIFQ
jgi:uncharacterized protein GlcG (DUF336 family)